MTAPISSHLNTLYLKEVAANAVILLANGTVQSEINRAIRFNVQGRFLSKEEHRFVVSLILRALEVPCEH